MAAALTLGHLHAEDVWGPVGHPIRIGHAADAIERHHGSDLPTGDAADLDEDACAICAAMHLAATGAPVAAPFLPRPRPAAPTVSRSSEALSIRQAFTGLPQSRAPPAGFETTLDL